jgi:hypothetical protein
MFKFFSSDRSGAIPIIPLSAAMLQREHGTPYECDVFAAAIKCDRSGAR